MRFARPPSAGGWMLGAFAAGLMVGLFWPFGPGWALALAVPIAAAGCLPKVGPWHWVGLIGLVHGLVTRASDRHACVARWGPGSRDVIVRIDEPLLGRSITSATVLGERCGGSITLRPRESDSLWAGDRVRLGGTWAPRPGAVRADGLMIVDRLELVTRTPGLVDRLRNWLSRTSHRLFGPRAGLVEALVVGTRGTLDPGISRMFARAGLVHLLSISGFHVGLIAAWIVLIGRLLKRRKVQAQAVAVVVIAGYVAFIGAPPPALRAAALGALGLLETYRQRAVAPGPLFAVTALVVLAFDPWAIADLGAWLSVTALWGATAATRWSDRALGDGIGWRIVAGSVGATVFTAPPAAFALGQVSLAGIGLNVIGIPLAAIAVPGVLAALLAAAIWEPLARSLAAGSGLALGLLEGLAAVGARLPGAALAFEPGVAPGLVALAVIGAGVIVVGRNTTAEAGRRLAWMLAPIPLASLVFGVMSRPHLGSGLTLHFLDVGQGDAALVETPRHHWILIDAGPASPTRDAGAKVVLPYLARRGVARLDLAVISHGHLDHYGGSRAVLAKVPAALVLEPGRLISDQGYLDWLDQLGDLAEAWRPLRAGDRFTVDSVGFEVLHPDSTWSGWGDDVNNDSVVLRLRYGRFEALFSGDAGFAAEERLRGRVGRVDLLKVGHHGSRTSSGAGFLAEIHPAVAIVSTGPNRYGHPSPDALGRLDQARVAVWRTDREGTVTVEVGVRSMLVTGRSRTAVYPIE